MTSTIILCLAAGLTIGYIVGFITGIVSLRRFADHNDGNVDYKRRIR